MEFDATDVHDVPPAATVITETVRAIPTAEPSTSVGTIGPERLRALLQRDGGFTVDLRTGSSVRWGISVGMHPSLALTLAAGFWDDEVVATWLRWVTGPRRWNATHLGGWIDPADGAVWLEPVRIVPPPLRTVAKLLGRWNDQLCVFDLRRTETLCVGTLGAGTPDAGTPAVGSAPVAMAESWLVSRR